jgi:hypothetical protein
LQSARFCSSPCSCASVRACNAFIAIAPNPMHPLLHPHNHLHLRAVPGVLDTASWNVAVSPQAQKRHREGDDVTVVTDARSAKGGVGRTNSAPSSGSLQSQRSQRSPLGGLDRRNRVDDPRADCHGEGCILLGSCRDAACVQDAVSVSDDGHLVLESARSKLPPFICLFVFISSTMRFLRFSGHNTGWGHIRH